MILKDNLYKPLKWVAMVILPAVATLYTALAGLWGLPMADAVAQTICAVATFLGVVLGISSKNYYNSNDNNRG